MADEATSFEKAGRWTKAWKLVRWMQRNGLGLAEAEEWEADRWALAARSAGIARPPSESTRNVVLGILAGADD